MYFYVTAINRRLKTPVLVENGTLRTPIKSIKPTRVIFGFEYDAKSSAYIKNHDKTFGLSFSLEFAFPSR